MLTEFHRIGTLYVGHKAGLTTVRVGGTEIHLNEADVRSLAASLVRVADAARASGYEAMCLCCDNTRPARYNP